MTDLLIHTNSTEEQNLLESILKKMKISFERIRKETFELSEDEQKSILQGLKDAQKGEFCSSEDVRKKAEKICFR